MAEASPSIGVIHVKTLSSTSSLPKLSDATSFTPWKLAFVVWLRSNGLEDIIVSPPPNYKAEDVKKSADAMLGLQQTVEAFLLPSILPCATAAEAWKLLHTMFEGQNQARLSQVKAKLASISILPNEKAVAYYGRAMALYNDLRVNCDKSITDRDVVTFILNGLKGREDFKIVRSTLLYSDIKLSEILVRLMDAEADNDPEEAALSAFVAKAYCKYCKGNVGHELKNCPKVAEKEARKKKKRDQNQKQKQEKNDEEALLGDAGAGPSGLHATKFRACSTWEEAGL
jgi:hypothetical protein